MGLRGTGGEGELLTHSVERSTVIPKEREVDKRQEVCDWEG